MFSVFGLVILNDVLLSLVQLRARFDRPGRCVYEVEGTEIFVGEVRGTGVGRRADPRGFGRRLERSGLNA